MATAATDLPALDPLDYLALDALLDDEERAVRDTVRQFVREEIGRASCRERVFRVV